MKIHEELKKIRESKKITRKTMADALSISPDTLKDIEYGRIRLSLENFILICNFLEISPMYFLKHNQNEKYIILNQKDFDDLNRIIEKINKQINNQTNKQTNTITQNDQVVINNYGEIKYK